MEHISHIVKVLFIEDNREEFYGSLRAIYEHHTPQEIGVAYGTLHNSPLPRTTRYCIISRHEVLHMKQKKPKKLARTEDNI